MDLPPFGDNRIYEYARIYTVAYAEAYDVAQHIGLSLAECANFAHDEAQRITRAAEHGGGNVPVPQ